MPKHVQLPPILPYLPVAPMEKKEKARRKEKIGTDKDGNSESKTEATSAPKAPPPENPVHSTNPLATSSGGMLGVLLDAQEEATPADQVTRRPDDEIEGS
ncbi:MAG TPA: hypothetical protein VMB81_18600 [Candidatus Sulfotelmatobacter sp.]|nr:hypothetical protein [Candidatus Sulfotelmatobacter sp.]